ncbi:MAG: toxin-antitoxin system YwqK family antitoxin [Cryomorphaceae bacterium]
MKQKFNANALRIKVWLTLAVLFITGLTQVQAQADTTIWNFFNRSRLKIYSSDGDLRRIIWIKNGEQHGKTIHKYEGRVTSKAHFRNGKRSGKTKSYHSDGSVSDEGHFTGGLRSGIQRRYYKNGQLEFEIGHTIIEENGERKSVLHGPNNKYMPNGDPIYIGEYAYGKTHGRWESYATTGELRDVSTLKEGKQHGPFEKYRDDYTLYQRGILYEEIEIDGITKKKVYDGTIEAFHPNGQLQRSVEYDMGKIHGFREFYHDNGQLRSKQEYISGQPTGPLIEYDENGQKYSEKHFEILEVDGRTKGLEHGWARRWKDGVLVSEDFMQYGKAEGTSRSWYNDGTLKYEINFTEGLFDGEKSTYYPDGKKESINRYRIVRLKEGYDANVMFGWQLEFEPGDMLSTATYYDSTQTAIIKKTFHDNEIFELKYNDLLTLRYAPKGTLQSLRLISKYGYPFFSASYFMHSGLSNLQFYIPDSRIKQYIDYSSQGTITARYTYSHNDSDSKHSAAYAQELTEAVGTELVPNSFYTDSVKHGDYTLRFGNGDVAARMHFIEDVPHGEFLFYHPLTGDTLLYRNYIHGRQMGPFTEKWSGEHTRLRGIKREGELPGDLEEYTFDGKPSAKSIVDPTDGSVDIFSYHPNGQLKSQRNELKQSEYTYSPEGDLLSERLPLESDSSKVRVEMFFPKSGLLKSQSYYFGGQRDSIWTRYHPSGELFVKETYRDNERNGMYEEYTEDGTLRTKGIFREGKKHGEWTEPTDGEMKTVLYKNGKREVLLPEKACACIDTTRAAVKYLMPRVDDLIDYATMSSYLPTYLKPVDSLNFSALFNINLYTGGNRNYKTSDFTLITYNKIAFNIPEDKQLQLTLNPCLTKGYPSEIQVSTQFIEETKQVTGRIRPKRIGVSFLKGQVKSADENYEHFTALRNINSIHLTESGALELSTSSDKAACYTKARIGDNLEIEVEDAQISLFYDRNMIHTYPTAKQLELFEAERKCFRGLVVPKAVVTIASEVDDTAFEFASTRSFLLLGGAFASGELTVAAHRLNDGAIEVTDVNGTARIIDVEKFKQQWTAQGFSRLRMVYDDTEKALLINFFIE